MTDEGAIMLGQRITSMLVDGSGIPLLKQGMQSELDSLIGIAQKNNMAVQAEQANKIAAGLYPTSLSKPLGLAYRDVYPPHEE